MPSKQPANRIHRQPKTHSIKIVSPHYEYIKEGRKNFEVRFDDRDYKMGDILILQEHNYVENGHLKPTGEFITRKIKHILRKFKGLQQGYIVLGLEE